MVIMAGHTKGNMRRNSMGIKNNRGGARKGAGLAKDLHGARTERYSVTLDAATIALAREIGHGNMSLGIRMAVASIAAGNDDA